MSILNEVENILDEAQRYNTYISAICPFHDDTRPSLLVYEDTYKCLSCGAFGKTNNLLSQIAEATSIIVKPTKTRFVKNPWTKWTRIQPLNEVLKSAWKTLCKTPSSYLSKRGIPHHNQKKLGLGYLDDWYTFPIRNQEGGIIGSVARAGEENKSKAKYIYPSGQNPNSLYVPSWERIVESKVVFLTFGILDSISIYLSGYGAMSTTTGKHLHHMALEDIRKPIVIVPDKGEEIEAYHLASSLGWRGRVGLIRYSHETKDPNDVFCKSPKKLKVFLHEME